MEIYVVGALLANAIYYRRLQELGGEIKEVETDSSAVFEAIRGLSLNLNGQFQ